MRRLQDFEGRWALSRRITDARTGGEGRLEGTARFTPDAEGLRYEETGTLTLGGTSVAASRVYLWRAAPGLDGIDVFFDDGRAFHRIGEGDRPETFHDCAPDRYAGQYDFTGWPVWQLRWQVTGPRKDYSTLTIFHRLSS